MDWIYFLEKGTQQKLNLLLYMKENTFTLHELAAHFSWHEKTVNTKLTLIEERYPELHLFRENKLVYWRYQPAMTIYQILTLFFSDSPLFSLLNKAAWGIPINSHYTRHQYQCLNQRLVHYGFFIQDNESALLGNEGAIRKFLFDFARDFPDLCPAEIQQDLRLETTEPTTFSEQLMSNIIRFRQVTASPKLSKFCWELSKNDQKFHLFQQNYPTFSDTDCLYLYLFLHAETSSDFSTNQFPYKLTDIYRLIPEMKPWLLFIQHVLPELSDQSKQPIFIKLLIQRLFSHLLHTEQFLNSQEKEKIVRKLSHHPKMLKRLQMITARQPTSITSNSGGQYAQLVANYRMIEPILSLSEIEQPFHICLLLKLPKTYLKRLQKAIQHDISLFHAVQITIHFGNEIPAYADICITDYYRLISPSQKPVITLFFSPLFFEELIVELTDAILQLEKNR